MVSISIWVDLIFQLVIENVIWFLWFKFGCRLVQISSVIIPVHTLIWLFIASSSCHFSVTFFCLLHLFHVTVYRIAFRFSNSLYIRLIQDKFMRCDLWGFQVYFFICLNSMLMTSTYRCRWCCHPSIAIIIVATFVMTSTTEPPPPTSHR